MPTESNPFAPHGESDETKDDASDVDYRDATTGEFVTEEYAEANPDTTVSETEPEEREPDSPLPVGDNAPAEEPQSEQVEESEQSEQEDDKSYTDAKIDDVLAEIGDDKELAQLALDEENAKDKPRATLVSALEKIISEDADE